MQQQQLQYQQKESEQQQEQKLVNSGMLFPKGMGPPNGSTTFTLTFEKAGTYDYYCILHPWQKGKVAVQ
jgi:plastocyanin